MQRSSIYLVLLEHLYPAIEHPGEVSNKFDYLHTVCVNLFSGNLTSLFQVVKISICLLLVPDSQPCLYANDAVLYCFAGPSLKKLVLAAVTIYRP